MVKVDITYEGNLHCRLHHGPSGQEVVTDAPKDNMGKGAAFSPTDMVAGALGACMLTIMGIYANRHDINIAGSTCEVQKDMSADPRRIGQLSVVFSMARGIPRQQRTNLEKVAHTCPVHKSLHPDIKIPVAFKYPD